MTRGQESVKLKPKQKEVLGEIALIEQDSLTVFLLAILNCLHVFISYFFHFVTIWVLTIILF